EVWPGELAEGHWSPAAAALDRWTRGDWLVAPPTVMALQAIRDRPTEQAPARLGPLLRALAAGALHPIFFAPDVQLLPLRTLALGACPDGGGPGHLEALHTPGHAPGHLAFYEPHYRLLFAGDMVSTLSSVVIAPPEGDLVVYLRSLERLRTLDCRLLLPGHGN